MDRSVAQSEAPGGKQKTSKHIVVDERFCEVLASDFGIALTDVREALLNEPQKKAISICEWAESAEKSPMKRGEALTRWAKKNHSGAYKNGTPGRSGGPMREAVQREDRCKTFSPEQVMANLERMAG